ncbi:hypothetical protein Tco_0421503 [Tanacetum coccineum]
MARVFQRSVLKYSEHSSKNSLPRKGLFDERARLIEDLRMKEREGATLEASLVTEGITLDDNLVAKESTYDSVTSSKKLDKSNSSRNDVYVEKILVDMFASDIENADIGPSYDRDTMSKVHHDMFKNGFAHRIHNHEQPESIPDTYMLNKNNSNIISDIPNMDLVRDKEEHDYVDDQQQHAFFASLVNNLKCEGENYTKVNREALQANALLIKELEKYKEKEKHFAKETTNKYEHCKKIKLLNKEISNLKSQACQKKSLSTKRMKSMLSKSNHF